MLEGCEGSGGDSGAFKVNIQGHSSAVDYVCLPISLSNLLPEQDKQTVFDTSCLDLVEMPGGVGQIHVNFMSVPGVSVDLDSKTRFPGNKRRHPLLIVWDDIPDLKGSTIRMLQSMPTAAAAQLYGPPDTIAFYTDGSAKDGELGCGFAVFASRFARLDLVGAGWSLVGFFG